MPEKLEPLIIQKVRDIASATCVKIVNTENLVTVINEALTQMRAEKACAPCH